MQYARYAMGHRQPRQRRLNIPLPPMRPVGERHLSPFYRPPVVKPQETIAERKTRQGWSDFDQRVMQIAARIRRYRRQHRNLGSDYKTALEKAYLDYWNEG